MKNSTENKPEKIKDKKRFFGKTMEALKKKWLIKISQTLILVIIILAVYIGISLLLKKVVLPEIDFTTNKVYSISTETKDKIKNIDKEIKVMLINYGTAEKESVVNFIERYIEINKNIKIEKIDDLASRSDIMAKHSLNPTDSLIVISCGQNEKELYESDLYTFDYATYKQIDRTEEAVTNAIVNVTRQEKTKIYFMSNHLMYSTQYYTKIIQDLEEEANEVENLDILVKGEIPTDCECLVISTLKEDLTEQEKNIIISYIHDGGNILLMCGPNINNASLNNFQLVLDEYGLEIEKGVIFEGDTSKIVSGYPDFIVCDIQDTTLTSKLDMNLKIGLLDAGKLILNQDKANELGIKYETLAKTSEKAFLRTNLNQQSVSRTALDSEEQECIVSAIATKTIENKESKLVIFSNELFAMDMPIQNNGYQSYAYQYCNNEDMVLNSISYLTEREDTITIRKEGEEQSYTVTEKQHQIITIIIFGLPILIIILGIIVWQVRRRKK